MSRDEDYRLLECTTALNRCVFCGSEAQLWELSTMDRNVTKVVTCSNDGGGLVGDECPLYLPPECFYKATKREAIAYWQERTALARERILREAV